MVSISVALATYNGARFLQAQLDSILNQSRPPDELVVGDDGSSDSTLDIVRRFREAAPFPVTQLSVGPRRGFAGNFFHIVSNCSGDLIALCDQDDVWRPEKLAVSSERMLADKSLLSIHTSILTDAALAPIGLDRQGKARGIHGDRIVERLEIDPFENGSGNAMMVARSIAEFPSLARPEQPDGGCPLYHDLWFYVLAAAFGRVSHIEQPLLLYRQHLNNTCGFSEASLWKKASAMLSIPVGRYRSQAKFYEEFAALFELWSQTMPAPYGPLCADAAEVYRRRRRAVEQRLALYTAKSPPARLDAFRQTYRAGGEAASVPHRVMSATKDMVLGVCQFGQLDHSGWR